MVELRHASDAEIQSRIASGNYDRLPPGPARYGGGRGHIVNIKKDPVLGRIGIHFHPNEVPAVAKAYGDRKAFLEHADHVLKSFFY